MLAVHDHVIDLLQCWRGFCDELKPLAAESQITQSGVQVIELLLGIVNLLAQFVDEVLHQLLLGKFALPGNLRFVLRQLRTDKLVTLFFVALGVLVFIQTKIVFKTIGLFGFAQLIAAALFGVGVIVFVTSCVF